MLVLKIKVSSEGQTKLDVVDETKKQHWFYRHQK